MTSGLDSLPLILLGLVVSFLNSLVLMLPPSEFDFTFCTLLSLITNSRLTCVPQLPNPCPPALPSAVTAASGTKAFAWGNLHGPRQGAMCVNLVLS